MIRNNNILIAQGGGPTHVINQSLVGVIRQEKKQNSSIFGALNGVNGIINNRFILLNKISNNDLNLIANTQALHLDQPETNLTKKYCIEILNILKSKKLTSFITLEATIHQIA